MRAPMIVANQEGFRLWSESYDATPNPLLALEERILPGMLPAVRGKRVLDIGCGTGRWITRLSEQTPARIVGIDGSPAMLAHAARKQDAESGLRVRGGLVTTKNRAGTTPQGGPAKALVCGDCQAIPLGDACFELLLCSFTLGYVADLNGFAREVARIAAPRADLLVCDIHPDTHRRGWRRSFRAAGQEVSIQNFVRELPEIAGALTANGFREIGVREEALGAPERDIFDRAGKGHQFEAAAAGPAIYIAHFRGAGS